MSLSTIEKIDALFAYLYTKGSKYSKYREIVKDYFKGDEENNDIEGMLIKLATDGFVDTGKFTRDSKLLGWSEETTYKLSFEGRFIYENCHKNKPYRSLRRTEKRKKAWEVIKIIAALINAILVIGVAVWAALVQAGRP